MQQLFETPLAAGPSHLDRAAMFHRRRTWTWRKVHQASAALAERLEGATAVCNLCASRLGFLITCLAALRGRCLLILPPSGSNADLVSALQGSARPIMIGDPDTRPALAPGSTPYLRCDPDSLAARSGAAGLAWEPRWDEAAVLLFTSGSTGVPAPQPKTLAQLTNGALALGARLERELDGGLAGIGRIVCSVAPQHMFGLECSVMLPLVHGTPVLDQRPLLPADVRAAFDGLVPGAWIATPMHLRSLVQSEESLPSCRVVIASTMPLAQPVARQCEQRLEAPVLEIYGSTETGVLAMRRTARETRWRPLDGVRMQAGAQGSDASGTHFASPVKLLDELLLDAGGSFTLLGRQADLVKIAGRRASLAGLNLLLQELPGLHDGVFYLPASDSPTERLCLIYSGPPLELAAARRWLRPRLDPVFLPRSFIHLDRLPRADNGKLRRDALDRVYGEWQATARPRKPAVASARKQMVLP